MTKEQMRSAVMSDLAKDRWKKQSKKARKDHASKMGLASAAARAKKAAFLGHMHLDARQAQVLPESALLIPLSPARPSLTNREFRALGFTGGSRDRVRELVRIRDGRTCQKCHKKWRSGTRRLDVHHLDEEVEGKSFAHGAATWDREHMDRMITLCHKCHLNLDTVRRKMALRQVA